MTLEDALFITLPNDGNPVAAHRLAHEIAIALPPVYDAAHDLLAGCQHIVAYIEGHDRYGQMSLLSNSMLRDAYVEAKAAIAKAKGIT
jgi:hypothetical protein